LTTWATVVTVACWSLFGITWGAGALYNARHSPRKHRPRPIASGAAGAAVGAVILANRLIPASSWRALELRSDWLRIPGVVLLLAATAFTIWARVALGTMWSSAVVARADHELRTHGPYAIVRHPIYTGMLGMAAGSMLLAGLGRWTSAVLAAGIVFAIRVPAEDRLMAELFGERYASYRRRVPALLPFGTQQRR
jgi:protein-S-isoprenylcysteine O-methyltransferase Ste14